MPSDCSSVLLGNFKDGGADLKSDASIKVGWSRFKVFLTRTGSFPGSSPLSCDFLSSVTVYDEPSDWCQAGSGGVYSGVPVSAWCHSVHNLSLLVALSNITSAVSATGSPDHQTLFWYPTLLFVQPFLPIHYWMDGMELSVRVVLHFQWRMRRILRLWTEVRCH